MRMRNESNRTAERGKRICAAILLAAFVALYKPPIVEAIGNLFRSTYYALANIRSFQLNLKTPHAGEHILPTAVQEMLILLRTHHIEDYRISEQIAIAENGLVHQRIVESGWPAKLDLRSHNKLLFISEWDASPRCMEIGREKEIILVFCN
jgi:hypothetical protein